MQVILGCAVAAGVLAWAAWVTARLIDDRDTIECTRENTRRAWDRLHEMRSTQELNELLLSVVSALAKKEPHQVAGSDAAVGGGEGQPTPESVMQMQSDCNKALSA